MKYCLRREKLQKVLLDKHLKLTAFAKEAGISRQSLYNMFEGTSVLRAPFQKILDYLQLPIEAVLEREEGSNAHFKTMPLRIRQTALELAQFAKEKKAAVVLFGSRAREKKGGCQSDWDFGVFFHHPNKKQENQLRLLKQKCIEVAFPYRIDIVILNRAPDWFLETVAENYICLEGTLSKERLLHQKAA